jgi:RAT1-interacting protein
MEGGLSVSGWLHAHPPASFGAPDAPVEQPAQLLSGWRSSAGVCEYSGCAPAALALPALPCSLDAGVAAHVPKDSAAKAGVEAVIAAARAAGADLAACDVLSFRSNLNKICGTPHDAKTPWTVDACLLRGTLFLDIVKPEEQPWMRTPEQLRMQAWGYVFEACCTGAAVSDANQETCVLVSTRVGGHRLLLGAEIDCYDAAAVAPGAPPTLASLRELKTFKAPEHRGQCRTLYALKHPKWWLQSHLAGVAALVLGQRDDGGVVYALHTVPTHELPLLSQHNGEWWSPHQALAFGADVLSWCRDAVAQHAGQHLRFVYEPATGVISAHLLADGDLPARLAAALPGA